MTQTSNAPAVPFKAYPPGARVSTFSVLKSMLFPRPEDAYDPLEDGSKAQEKYGDLTYSQIGPVGYYQVTSPELTRQVLVEKADKFVKPRRFKFALGHFLGQGLLTNDGDPWRRQRRLAQPAFHSKRIENYAQTMVDYSQQAVAEWRDGQTRDVAADMMQLTLRIVAKTLFDSDITRDSKTVASTMPILLDMAEHDLNAIFLLPSWLPTAKRRRQQGAIAKINQVIQHIIEERRRSKVDHGDLLSMLMLAVDDDDKNGGQMTDQQLRDVAMTIFLAGHETTANVMNWTWYLLAQHPEIEAKPHAELDQALTGRCPTLKDLANLPYTEQIIKESMRLFPPAPGVIREAVEPVELGGYMIQPGKILSVAIYSMHHDARYFEDPSEFKPERFSKENEASIPRYAYIPFSSGPRVCIGNSFAMMEARLVLATIAQQVCFSLAPGQVVKGETLITLRPKGGLPMRISVRQP